MVAHRSLAKDTRMIRVTMDPFLKWAGGKRWLFKSGQFSPPEFKGKYIEPFLGGGAAFFKIQPRDALLADINERLIELYAVIRDELEEFEYLLRQHAALHSKNYYYEVRSKRLRKPTTRAAQFMYLNRTCWNGLYRENKQGQFNVPMGAKQTVIFQNDDFKAWSKVLKNATLAHQDFETTINSALEGDFLFVDPPYTVRHNMNGFVKYNQKIFAWGDQIRLCKALRRAVSRGVSFAMTNADHESVKDLYKGFGQHVQINRHSVIAAKALHRSRSTELLITK